MAASKTKKSADVVVIGAGMAGIAAAMSALSHKKKVTVIAGRPGATALSGAILYDIDADPAPDSPRARIGLDRATAVRQVAKYGEQFIFSGLRRLGLDYRVADSEPMHLITDAGPAAVLAAPRQAARGDLAKLAGKKVAVVSLRGLAGCPPLFISPEAGRSNGHSLFAELIGSDRNITFKSDSLDVSLLAGKDAVGAFELAHALEREAVIDKLSARISSLISGQDCDAVALPPVIGVDNSAELINRLEKDLGCRVVEMGSTCESVTGLRLHRALAKLLAESEAEVISGRATAGRYQGSATVSVEVETADRTIEVSAGAAVLAAGRFISGGLIDPVYDRMQDKWYHDPVFGIVAFNGDQPQKVTDLDKLTFTDAAADHPLFELGLRTDEHLRPVSQSGNIVSPRIFAAGSILQQSDSDGLAGALLTGATAGSRATEATDAA